MAKPAKKTEPALTGHNSEACTAAEALQYYKDMLLIRRFEEKAGQLYGMGLIAGFCHLYIGQEAVVVGCRAATEAGDASITGYRDHGHCLMWGMSPESVMAELTGRAAGCSKGKGGSMHMFNTAEHFYGGHGIVGAQIPLGAGLAFAQKYNDTDRVTLSFIGDGGANQGQVYEAMNMAALWKLPVIFVIENNGYAMGTAVKRAASGQRFADRGLGFGIEGEQVDGMDVVKVRNAVRKAVAACRKGEGPKLLEVMTYRYRGHSMSDPAKYRSKEEVEQMKDQHDPIEGLKKFILAEKFASEEELKNIDKEIKQKMNEVAEFAKTAPEPDASELMTEIYYGE
jgi:pyruvate dehydrogenase E1 component alpha subunit